MSIKIENLSYIYAEKTPGEHQALFDINLDILDHTFMALIGETGSGKSTLVQHLNGLIYPTKGKITIGDYCIEGGQKKHKGIKKLRQYCGLVFQFPEYQLFEETVLKDVSFGPKNFGLSNEESIEKAKESLSLVGLDESYYNRSPFELSGGEKRRVAIAGIIALSPKILVLDEPTAGLDPHGEREMLKLFQKIYGTGTSIVLVTHNMDIVLQYAQDVVVLSKGKIVKEAKPLELFQQLDFLKKVAIEPPYIFKVAMELIDNGLPLNLENIKDIETLAKEIRRVKAWKIWL